jgi:carbamoylphosphate synthase large subunit
VANNKRTYNTRPVASILIGNQNQNHHRVLLNETSMNNLWMEYQMVLVTLSENQNTFVSDIHRIDSIRSMHDVTIVTRIVTTRLDAHATKRANERVTIRRHALVERVRRGKDGNRHAKMNSSNKRWVSEPNSRLYDQTRWLTT